MFVVLYPFFVSEAIDVWVGLGITAALYFFYWLIAPYLSDWVFRLLYRLRWVGIEELQRRDPAVAQFIEQVCRSNKIKVPKIGFISDDNPQAFVYGSAAFNARMVFTNGIFTYLDTDERKAVFGHELAHIINRDFIVMTLAAFLVAALYHVYRVLIRMRTKKQGSAIKLLGLAAFVFYIVGTYLLLFLSRLREYFADERSAKWFSADALSRALVKVAYGIIAKPEQKQTSEIMQGTRTLGIMDFRASEGIGLSYIAGRQLDSWAPVQKAFLFDLHNPWAFLYELRSSHPLTAKRIRRLSQLGQVTAFNFEEIKRYPVDKKKLYAHFAKDAVFVSLPLLLVIAGAVLHITLVGTSLFGIFGACLIGFGLGSIIKVLYRYPAESPKEATTLSLMEDVYASPVRGKRTLLDGKVVGRGIPGLIFSKDMMFQDETGLIYLRYEGLVPLVSNLAFAFLKVKKLIGQEGRIGGWFMRSLAPRLELDFTEIAGKKIKSWIKFWGIIGGLLIAVAGLMICFI